MRICELGDGDGGLVWQQEGVQEASGGGELVRLKAKRALVGAGARVLFYPTLLYNVLRNRFEADFRWWDRIDQVLTLPSFCSAWILWLVVFLNLSTALKHQENFICVNFIFWMVSSILDGSCKLYMWIPR